MEDYRPQVDGLRALAIVGTLYYQFWNPVPAIDQTRIALFLTISGFVITHVLMTARDSTGRFSPANFLIRRLLRLAPPIILALVAVYLADADGFRASLAWHVLPLSNIYFALLPGQGPWPLSHFWSLSLLEQFYLIWPFVVMVVPARRFVLVPILGIAVMAFLRINATELGMSQDWTDWAVAVDPLLFGALACRLQRNPRFRAVLSDRMLFEAAAVVLVAPILLGQNFGNTELWRLASNSAAAIVVTGAFTGYSGLLGAALQSAPARFLGRISYGAYVYHMILWYFLGEIAPALYTKGQTTFVIVSVGTICVATLSWYLVEAPLSRLKRFFPMLERVTPAASAVQP